jgi:hypothetical protein
MNTRATYSSVTTGVVSVPVVVVGGAAAPVWTSVRRAFGVEQLQHLFGRHGELFGEGLVDLLQPRGEV